MRFVKSASIALGAVIAALVVRSLYAWLEYSLGGDQVSLPGWTSNPVGLTAYLAIPIVLASAVVGFIVGLVADSSSRMVVSAVAVVLFAAIVLRSTTWYAVDALIIDIGILVVGAAVAMSVAYLLGKTRDRRTVA
jgi:hypothetical protein